MRPVQRAGKISDAQRIQRGGAQSQKVGKFLSWRTNKHNDDVREDNRRGLIRATKTIFGQ